MSSLKPAVGARLPVTARAGAEDALNSTLEEGRHRYVQVIRAF
jgi:hypothetical protein